MRTHGQCPTCRHYGTDCHCHTSGPWIWDRSCGDQGESLPWLRTSDYQTILNEDGVPCPADARLIAAAPDLLAALQAHISGDGTLRDSNERATAWQLTHAAIAKASGHE